MKYHKDMLRVRVLMKIFAALSVSCVVIYTAFVSGFYVWWVFMDGEGVILGFGYGAVRLTLSNFSEQAIAIGAGKNNLWQSGVILLPSFSRKLSYIEIPLVWLIGLLLFMIFRDFFPFAVW